MKKIPAVALSLAALGACPVAQAQSLAIPEVGAWAPAPMHAAGPFLRVTPAPGPLRSSNEGLFRSPDQAPRPFLRIENNDFGPKAFAIAATIAGQALASRPSSTLGFQSSTLVLKDVTTKLEP